MLTAGQRHEQAALPALRDRGAGAPASARPWWPGTRATAAARCGELWRRGIKAMIPARIGERAHPRCLRAAYRERNVVERLINRLNQHRRVATRDEKRAANHQAMLTIAAILLWL